MTYETNTGGEIGRDLRPVTRVVQTTNWPGFR